jgi:hypothetical protein
MRRLSLSLLVCAGLGFAQQSSDLVGRWRSVETSKGGIGAMYDFLADGTARFSPGAIVPMQYRLDGDRLSTYPESGPPCTLSWTGLDKVRFNFGEKGETYTRLGTQRDPASPLRGEWIGSRDMDGKTVAVHWTFAADGSAVLMIRFLTMPGRYQVASGRLTATFGNQPGLSGPIDLANGILSIHRSDGRVTRLLRY